MSSLNTRGGCLPMIHMVCIHFTHHNKCVTVVLSVSLCGLQCDSVSVFSVCLIWRLSRFQGCLLWSETLKASSFNCLVSKDYRFQPNIKTCRCICHVAVWPALKIEGAAGGMLFQVLARWRLMFWGIDAWLWRLLRCQKRTLQLWKVVHLHVFKF